MRTIVWVKRGLCSADSLINIALCSLGVLPGVIHAWYIILKYPETYDPYEYHQVADGERGDGRTTYYVVTHEQPARRAQPTHGAHASYGTVGSQPSSGQFPGQQQGFVQQNQSKVKAKQDKKGAQPVDHGHGGEGSSSQPEGPPPTYADVIKGDNKVQKP